MAKMLADKNRRLVFVPGNGIANYHAPTVAELSAASVLDLSCIITANDYAFGVSGDEEINDPAYCADSNDTAPGRTNYEAAMNFYRYTTVGEDKGYSTFSGKGIEGYLVERIGKNFEAPFAAGDQVKVGRVITSSPADMYAPGGYEKFRMTFHVQGSQTDMRAKVAA